MGTFRPVIFCAQADAAASFFEFNAAEEFAHKSTNERHSGLSADENNLVEILRLKFRVSERAQAMRSGSGDYVAREIFEFGSGEFVVEAEIGCEEGKRDFDFGFGGEADLGGFGNFADAGEKRQKAVINDW